MAKLIFFYKISDSAISDIKSGLAPTLCRPDGNSCLRWNNKESVAILAMAKQSPR